MAQQSARRGRKNQGFPPCFISTLRVMWFRSANSHTGPQPSSLHQRPDRWQHPTTRQILQITACVARGVHRWKADVADSAVASSAALFLEPTSQILSRCEVLLKYGDCFLGELRGLRITGLRLGFVLGDALLVIADQRIQKRLVQRCAAKCL